MRWWSFSVKPHKESIRKWEEKENMAYIKPHKEIRREWEGKEKREKIAYIRLHSFYVKLHKELIIALTEKKKWQTWHGIPSPSNPLRDWMKRIKIQTTWDSILSLSSIIRNKRMKRKRKNVISTWDGIPSPSNPLRHWMRRRGEKMAHMRWHTPFLSNLIRN